MGCGGLKLTVGLVLVMAGGCAARTPPPQMPGTHGHVAIAHDGQQGAPSADKGAQPDAAAGGTSAQPGAAAEPPEMSAAAAYRARVERRAFQRGVRIIWVHPPRDARAGVNTTADMTPSTDPLRYQPTLR